MKGAEYPTRRIDIPNERSESVTSANRVSAGAAAGMLGAHPGNPDSHVPKATPTARATRSSTMASPIAKPSRRGGATRSGAILEVAEAFGTSLELQQVIRQGHDAIAQIVSADGVATCNSHADSPNRYELSFTERGSPAISAQVAVCDADPIRKKLLSQPSRVWRDTDFGSRSAYENSDVYRIAATLGDPAAVMLSGLFPIGPSRHGTFTVYRTSHHPFSMCDRAGLQRVFGLIQRAITNCIRFAEVARSADVLDGFFSLRKLGVVVCDAGGRELMRNERAQELLDEWFNPGSRGCGALPELLRAHVRALTTSSVLEVPGPLELPHPTTAGMALQLSFAPLRARADRHCFALVLEVRGALRPAPAHWRRRLTERELQVALLVRRGWNNATIASELGCAAGTVKKHLQSILDKLGVDNRMALIADSSS